MIVRNGRIILPPRVASMTRSSVLRLLSTGLFCGALTVSSGELRAAERPNFLVFIADDMAWDDCGAYGHPHIRTPHLDRLASEGLRFDAAFLTCSSCSPSRSSIMTGRYPHSTGGAHQLHNPLPGSQVVFPELLRAAGYYTASAGKWHLGPETVPEFDLVEQQFDRWVTTLKQRPMDRPFFFWFGFSDPHRPYQPGAITRPHTPEEVVVPPYLPDDDVTRRDLALYYDEIGRLDGHVGEVLAELDRQGAAGQTVVLFLTDNGRPFPRCKTTVYTSGVKMPLLVRWPGRVAPGSRTSSVVSSIDLAPTILELAGVPAGETFQGVSFARVLTDPAADVREYAYSEHNWHDFDDYQRAVRSQRFNYIRTWYTDVPGTPPADAVSGSTFQRMHKLRAAGTLSPAQLNPYVVPRPEEELYDVEADPHELHNLAGDPQFADVLTTMRKALEDWQRETDDRLPESRRPDEFDRVTGKRLPGFGRR
jgi:arylsulfatase A-like enzyme